MAMGLNMLGTGSDDDFEHMLTYAQETQHEKIIRGTCAETGQRLEMKTEVGGSYSD